MSKYLLFFILLFTLSASAQKNLVSTPPPQKWDEQEAFVNGFARVLQNNKFSFINTSGNLISPVALEAARNFSNHFSIPKWNVAPVTSPLEVQYPMACGTAHAQKRYHTKDFKNNPVSIVTGGDAGTAEGDFASCLVCILGALFYLYEFILQVSPSVMTSEQTSAG